MQCGYNCCSLSYRHCCLSCVRELVPHTLTSDLFPFCSLKASEKAFSWCVSSHRDKLVPFGVCNSFVLRPLAMGLLHCSPLPEEGNAECSYKNSISGPTQLGVESINLWWEWLELSWLDLWLGARESVSFSSIELQSTGVHIVRGDRLMVIWFQLFSICGLSCRGVFASLQ